MAWGRWLVCLVLWLPHTAGAQVDWEPDWHRFGIGDAITSGVALAGTLTIAFAVDTTEPAWERVGPFDAVDMTPLRPATREHLALASDPLAFATALLPVLVEPLLLYGRSADSAGQLAALGLRSHALALFATTLLKYTTRRARPGDSEARSANRSFPSGHTSLAFTGAALTCTNQRHLDIFHSRLAGRLACGVSVAVASLVGLLRLLAGRHHPSDVVVGAVVGLLSGWLVPALASYRIQD